MKVNAVEVKIRKYKSSDKACFVRFMEESQDYLSSIDSMKRTRRMPEYGESYTQRVLETIRKNNGVIYVAESEGRLIGLIAGIVARQSKEDLLECIPSKDGIILELFVDAQHRRQKVGTILMQRMEDYFRQNGCDASRVEVFEPNARAHNLYRKFGYTDRVIYLIKKL